MRLGKNSIVIVVLLLVQSLCLWDGNGWTQEKSPVTPGVDNGSAELREYKEAVSTAKDELRAMRLEEFLGRYPSSDKRQSAFELLMRSYQKLGDISRYVSTAERLLQEYPQNLAALGTLAFMCQHRESFSSDEEKRQERCNSYSDRGLMAMDKATKPEGLNDSEFLTFRNQVSVVFHTNLGLDALHKDNYALAQIHLQAAVDLSASDFSIVYPLALSYLNASPPNCEKGLWYIARSTVLGPNFQSRKQLMEFGRTQYIKFHGDSGGWQDLIQAATRAPRPPESFIISCKAN